MRRERWRAAAWQLLILGTAGIIACKSTDGGDRGFRVDASGDASAIPVPSSKGLPGPGQEGVIVTNGPFGSGMCEEHGGLAWVQVLEAEREQLFPASVAADSEGIVMAINGGKRWRDSPPIGYLLRLDVEGRPVWQRWWGQWTWIHDLSVNRDGRIAVSGRSHGNPCVDARTFESDPDGKYPTTPGFLVLLNREGSCSSELSMKGEVRADSVQIMDSGEAYVAGSFERSISIGENTYSAIGRADGFVLKVSSDGAPSHFKHLYEKDGDVFPAHIAPDPGGGLIVWAEKRTMIRRFAVREADPFSFVRNLVDSNVVMKFNAQMSIARTINLDPRAILWGPTVDSAGALLLAGEGCCPEITVVEKRAPEGRVLWRSVTRQDPRYDLHAAATVTDSDDNALVVGKMLGRLHFQRSEISDRWARAQIGDRDGYGFVVKLSPKGEVVWGRTIGGAYPWKIAVSGNSIYVLGWIEGSAIALEPATYIASSAIHPGSLFLARYCN